METVYSLSGEVPLAGASIAECDVSVLQTGAIVIDSVRRTCLIRKISAGGAVLHADLPVREGQRLELELETNEKIDGTVVWRRGPDVGLRFDEQVDVLPIVARNLARQPGERRRMPRVELSCPAVLETQTSKASIMLRDIAQGGAKIEAPFPLAVEQRVVIVPDGLRAMEGLVRWASAGLAGIAFDPELPWEELMPWLRARRSVAPSDFLPPPATIEIKAGGAPTLASSASTQAATVQLSLPARVREGTRRWTIEVASLSSRAVEFDCYAVLRLGTLLWIVLPGLEGWPARIVGIDGYRFNCEFTQPLHPAVLERVLSAAHGKAA